MRSFSDTEGRAWNLELSYPLVKEIRQLFGVNLLETSKATFDKIADPATLVDILFVLCRPQAIAMKVTDVQFGEALVGDPVEPATEALIEAIVDFFPKSKQETLRKLFAEIREIATLHTTELVRLIDSGELRRRLSPKRLSVASPDSSELTPAPGVSASSS